MKKIIFRKTASAGENIQKKSLIFAKKIAVLQGDLFYQNCGLRLDFLDYIIKSGGKLKKVTRHIFDAKDWGSNIEKVQVMGLHYAASDFILKKCKKSGLLNIDKKSKNKNEGKGKKIFYISPFPDKIKKIKDIEDIIFKSKNIDEKEIEKMTSEIGHLFGYPRCCIYFFSKHIPFTTSELNFILLKKSSILSWYLNNLDSQINILPHIPCSYFCPESKNFSEKVIRLIRRTEGDLKVKKLKKYLKSPFIYFKSGSFIRLEGHLKGKSFYYYGVFFWKPKEMFNKFDDEKKYFSDILQNVEKGARILCEKNRVVVKDKKNRVLLDLSKYKEHCIYTKFS